MKSSAAQKGYTIIEVMIFLAVSAGLLASASTVFNRQNQRTLFAQSVRDVETKLQDIVNDVDAGYFPSTNAFNCSAPPSSSGQPTISTGTTEQGANQDCIFIGKAIQFAPVGQPSKIDTYTIVGRRQTSGLSPTFVQSITDAQPRAVGRQAGTTYDSFVTRNGLEITKVHLLSGTDTGGIAVLSSFGDTGKSGTTQTSLANINSSINQDSDLFFNSISEANINSVQTSKGVVICLKDGPATGNGRKAAITLGKSAQKFAVESHIDEVPAEWGCP